MSKLKTVRGGTIGEHVTVMPCNRLSSSSNSEKALREGKPPPKLTMAVTFCNMRKVSDSSSSQYKK